MAWLALHAELTVEMRGLASGAPRFSEGFQIDPRSLPRSSRPPGSRRVERLLHKARLLERVKSDPTILARLREIKRAASLRYRARLKERAKSDPSIAQRKAACRRRWETGRRRRAAAGDPSAIAVIERKKERSRRLRRSLRERAKESDVAAIEQLARQKAEASANFQRRCADPAYRARMLARMLAAKRRWLATKKTTDPTYAARKSRQYRAAAKLKREAAKSQQVGSRSPVHAMTKR